MFISSEAPFHLSYWIRNTGGELRLFSSGWWQKFMIFMKKSLKAQTPKGWWLKMLCAHQPALAEPGYAAVVLIPSFFIKHSCMHDMPNWHIQVIREEILQTLQGLVSSGLHESKGSESQTSCLSKTNPLGQLKIASTSWPKLFQFVMIVTLTSWA